jgi:hypothetical protein
VASELAVRGHDARRAALTEAQVAVVDELVEAADADKSTDMRICWI